ncbi:MAG: cofactor-independent phosphoglycerate mutase [Desulfovibrio sp.]
MKVLFLVADGMGDWPDKDSGKTPMEVAATPNMDELAKTGIVGTCKTIPDGMPAGSDVANMSLVGYDPARWHTGRGPIEAAAQGIESHKDDLIWRMNTVRISEFKEKGTMYDYSASHISSDESIPLVQELNAICPDGFEMIPGIQYRHLLIQKNGANSPEAKLEITPPHDITDQPIQQDVQEFKKSDVLTKLMLDAEDFLTSDKNTTKANSIWPWGQGGPLMLPSFQETYGLDGAVISAVDIIRGLGFASKLQAPIVEGATGMLDTNYEGKVDKALEVLKDHQFAFVHLEGPDECGHAGDFKDKTEAIARFDARILGPLREALKDEEILFIITCDHFTPIEIKTHSPDPVPFILHYPGCDSSGLEEFSEKNAISTGLCIEEGYTLLKWCLNKAGIAENQ